MCFALEASDFSRQITRTSRRLALKSNMQKYNSYRYCPVVSARNRIPCKRRSRRAFLLSFATTQRRSNGTNKSIPTVADFYNGCLVNGENRLRGFSHANAFLCVKETHTNRRMCDKLRLLPLHSDETSRSPLPGFVVSADQLRLSSEHGVALFFLTRIS